MNQENYLFHSQTQILRTKQKKQQSVVDQKSLTDKFRLTNEHFNYSHKNRQESGDLKKLRYSLYTPKNQKSEVKDKLIVEWSDVIKNQNLVKGVSTLRNLSLLNKKEINNKVVPGKNHVRFIYNDYHQKFTNPGYSRNNLGCYYTR